MGKWWVIRFDKWFAAHNKRLHVAHGDVSRSDQCDDSGLGGSQTDNVCNYLGHFGAICAFEGRFCCG